MDLEENKEKIGSHVIVFQGLKRVKYLVIM